jgi:hypothetical protein
MVIEKRVAKELIANIFDNYFNFLLNQIQLIERGLSK